MKVKNFIQILLAALIVAFTFKYVIFAQSNSEKSIEMNEKDLRKTGAYKLSPSEQNELKNWISENYSPKETQTNPRITTSYKQLPSISGVTSDGNFVKLDDDTNWQIFPEDTPISSGWLTPSPIKVEYSGEGDYPYTLTNTITESTVRARKITHIPNNPTGYFKDLFEHFKTKGVGLNIII